MKIVSAYHFIDKIPNFTNVVSCEPRYVGFITEYELLCLRLVLGECLLEELLEQLEFVVNQQNPERSGYKPKVDADIKWHYLLYGRTYDANDIETDTVNFNNGRSRGCNCGCLSYKKCNKYYYKGLIEVTKSDFVFNGNVRYVEHYESLIIDFIMYKYYRNIETFTTATGEATMRTKNTEIVTNNAKGLRSYNDFVTKVIKCNARGMVGLYAYIQHFGNSYPNWEGSCLKFKPLV